ncbi:MAG: DUF5671 domain-containing protein [Acidimicrobiia bacterium]
MDQRRSMARLRLELPSLMLGLAILPLLVLLAIVMVVVIVVQRSMKKGEDKGGGADIISYLVLALAMGITGFALVQLATTAFPGDRFVFDPAQDVATALAGLVVATPFVVYFWRRQAARRVIYPASPGWTVYLALMQLVFLSAFVTSAVLVVDGWLSGDPNGAWVPTIVFGGLVGFHEMAARRTPPRSDAGELARVIAAAIGLVTAAVGLAGTLDAVFSLPFQDISREFSPWPAMLIVGAPIWGYQWFRKWDQEPGMPRVVWSVVVSIGSFVAVVGAGTALVALVLQYLFGDVPPAGQHFGSAPAALAILVTFLAVWVVHRRWLGSDRTNPLRAYEYAVAAVGLVTAEIGSVVLTIIAFDRSQIVGGGTGDVIGVATSLVAGLVVWLVFSRRWLRGDPGAEATAWPRRVYNLGLGVAFGLVAAGGLITCLFILLQRIIGDGDDSSLSIPLPIFVYSALGAWYLLAAHARDRANMEREDVVTPFAVTVICAHPGPIATKFPKQARLTVIHRADGIGVIDEDRADEIVAAVGHRPSLVWVEDDGFRVAAMLVPG